MSINVSQFKSLLEKKKKNWLYQLNQYKSILLILHTGITPLLHTPPPPQTKLMDFLTDSYNVSQVVPKR